MVIFNSYVSLPEATPNGLIVSPLFPSILPGVLGAPLDEMGTIEDCSDSWTGRINPTKHIFGRMITTTNNHTIF